MPEVKYFVVTQERKVKVTANSPIEAAQVAHAAFTNGQNSDGGVVDGPEGVYGNTTTHIEVTDFRIEKAY